MKYLLIIVSLLGTLHTIGQKPRWERITTTELQLPSSPLPDYVKKYNVKPSLTYSYVLNTDLLEAKIRGIKLEGYQKTLDGTGEIDIEFFMEPYKANYKETSNLRQKKNSDGVVISTYREYESEMTHSYPVTVIVTDRKTAEQILTIEVNHSPVKAGSKVSRKGFWDARKMLQGDQHETMKKLFETNLAKAEKQLNDGIGFPNRSLTLNYAYIKPKKYEYPNMDKGLVLIKEAYTNYQASAEIDPAFKTKAVEAISLWEGVVKEYDPDAKKKARINKKIAIECFRNIFATYLMLNDWSKCDDTLAKAHLIDDKFAWERELKWKFLDKKERYEANGK